MKTLTIIQTALLTGMSEEIESIVCLTKEKGSYV
jgi:hypothetical protein